LASGGGGGKEKRNNAPGVTEIKNEKRIGGLNILDGRLQENKGLGPNL